MFLVQELSKNFWLSSHHPPPNKISQKIILKKLGILHGSVKDVPNSTQSCILQSELKEPLWSKFVLPAYLGFPAKRKIVSRKFRLIFTFSSLAKKCKKKFVYSQNFASICFAKKCKIFSKYKMRKFRKKIMRNLKKLKQILKKSRYTNYTGLAL